MMPGKKEIPDMKIDLKLRKKKRLKKLAYWLVIDLLVAAVIFALLLYKPSWYQPAVFNGGSYERGAVSPYLTHELLPKIHHDAQLGKPFDLVITQQGINEIVAWSGWPKESEGVIFTSPAVLFIPENIVLMGTAVVKGVDFIVTIMVEPKIDEQNLLNLNVVKVKIGAVNITPLAIMLAKKSYEQRLTNIPEDIKNEWQTKIVASLLNNESFEPVFKVEDIKVHVESITIKEKHLILRLIPTS
jgi:hypothetical protein